MALNVLGEELRPCSYDPLTGYLRDGCCETCTAAFSRARGNDLVTPRPQLRVAGLKPGDRWCVCALRWLDALEAGCAPPVVLDSTHERALAFVSLAVLSEHAL